MEMIEDHLEKTPDALDSSLATKEKIHYTSLFSGGDLFYQFFLNGICLGKACYDRCDYRSDNSAADIRIGDLWGKKYQDNEEGVSALITFTPKGDEVVRNLRGCTLVSEPFEIAAEGQMKRNPEKPYGYMLLNRLLQTRVSLKTIWHFVRLLRLPKRIKNKIKKIFTK